MAGGLIQLAVYGTQDIFLTGSPQITFFKIVYRRHTNFAIESIKQHFVGIANFGNEISSVIEKAGDLMGKVYLEIDLPKINLLKNPSDYTLDRHNITDVVMKSTLLYQLVYKYIQANTAIIRKLKSLISTDNINWISIEKIMKNQTFLENIFDHRQHLIDHLSIEPNINFMINLIPKFDIKLLFDSIVCKPLSNLQKYNAIILIMDKLLQPMREFYLESFNAKIYYEELAKNHIDGLYFERYKFAWVEELGNAIIDYVEIKIGNHVIDKHTGDWLIIDSKTSIPESHIGNYHKMIGNIAILNTFNADLKSSHKLIIPLKFWFCKYVGSALPLIALRYHDVTFNIKLKDLSKCCYFEDHPSLTASVDNIQTKFDINIIDANLFVDYIYLETTERKRFASSTHEYLIEVIQYVQIDDIQSDKFTIDLNFSNPIKYLVWFCQPTIYRENPTGKNRCQWNNFGSDLKDNIELSTLASTYISINLCDRTDKFINPMFYNYVHPYMHFNHNLPNGLYAFSFGLKPLEHQPSGSINASRLDQFSIISTINDHMRKYLDVGLFSAAYAVSNNILRIFGGMGNLAFK